MPDPAVVKLKRTVGVLAAANGLTIGLAIALTTGAFGRVPITITLLAAGGAVLALVASMRRFERIAEVVTEPLVAERQRLEEVRRDFVANVSHELKTPLTAARGLVETMLDDPEMAAATRQSYLEKVRDQTHRMSALVSDLISLSRLEAESRSTAFRPLDLRSAAIDALQATRASAEQRGVVVRFSPGEQSLVINGDDATIEQALINLLDNAIKYSPASGAVEFVLASDGDTAVVSVTDRGPGIPAEHRERIFERFYRVDRARARELGGTGLGLAIVKHAALSHGGDVNVESEVGVGSTFRLRLPRARTR